MTLIPSNTLNHIAWTVLTGSPVQLFLQLLVKMKSSLHLVWAALFERQMTLSGTQLPLSHQKGKALLSQGYHPQHLHLQDACAGLSQVSPFIQEYLPLVAQEEEDKIRFFML